MCIFKHRSYLSRSVCCWIELLVGGKDKHLQSSVAAWLATLSDKSSPLSASLLNPNTPVTDGGRRHVWHLCVIAQDSPAERNRRLQTLGHSLSPIFTLFPLILLEENFLHTLQTQD